MPRYDYRCRDCERGFTLTYESIAAMEAATPTCPHCGSTALNELIRRVRVMTSEEQRLEKLADPARLGALEDEDPREMGRLLREMANETGEDPGEEFNEVIDRLEAGESPESIEQSMDMSSLDAFDD